MSSFSMCVMSNIYIYMIQNNSFPVTIPRLPFYLPGCFSKHGPSPVVSLSVSGPFTYAMVTHRPSTFPLSLRELRLSFVTPSTLCVCVRVRVRVRVCKLLVERQRFMLS